MIRERESSRVATAEGNGKTTENPKKIGKNKALLIGGSVVGVGLALAAGGVLVIKELDMEDDASPSHSQTQSKATVDSSGPQLVATKENPLRIPVVTGTEPEARPKPEAKKVNSDEVHDSEPNKRKVKESMIERLPEKEIYGLFPDAFGKLRGPLGNKIITLPYKPTYEEHIQGRSKPDIQVEIGEKKNTLQLEYPLDLSQSADPNAEITVTKTFTGFEPRVREEFQGIGYYDTIHLGNVPNGAIVHLPLDGFTTRSASAEDLDKTAGFNIYTVAQNGDFYMTGIAAYENSTIDLPDPRDGDRAFLFKDLADTPLSNLQTRHFPIGSYGKKNFRGSAILEVNNPQGKPVEIVLMVRAHNKKGGQTPAFSDVFNTPYVLTNLEFLTAPDGKLLASSVN